MIRRSFLHVDSNSRCVWCWIAVSFVERLQVTCGCATNADCITSCQQATPSAPCSRSTCDSTYSTCSCGDNAALLETGGCASAPPIVVGGCQLGYSAQLFTVVTASPELQQGDLSNNGGHASAALITILRRCMASGLGRQAHEVVSRGVTLTASRRLAPRYLQFANGLQGNFLQASIIFDFCVGQPAIPLNSLTAGTFDSAFGSEANRFATFHGGTIRVERITSTDPTTTTTTLIDAGQQQIIRSAKIEEDGTVTWMLIGACSSMTIVILVLFVWYIRLPRSSATLVEPISLPAGASAPNSIPRVTANVCFGVEDLNLPEGNDIQALSLKEGDVLEVMMNCGEWLFGRHMNKPEETGYFPESYVSWWGRPLSADIQPSRSQSALPETIGLPAGVESSLREVGRQPEAEEPSRAEGSGSGPPSVLAPPGPTPPSVRAPPRPAGSEVGQETGAVSSRAPTVLGVDGVSTSCIPQSADRGPVGTASDLQSTALASPRFFVEPFPAFTANADPVPSSNVASNPNESSLSMRQGCDAEDTPPSFNSRPSFGREELPPEGPASLEKSPSFSDMLEELTAERAPTPPEPPPLLITPPLVSEQYSPLPNTLNADSDAPRISAPSDFSFTA